MLQRLIAQSLLIEAVVSAKREQESKPRANEVFSTCYQSFAGRFLINPSIFNAGLLQQSMENP
ncbi:MAG: hypothetical protein FJ308_01635 [Planctomycetes bacterium]|nr:hypothetical protein [Planctomycetota bacterium]